MSRNVAVKELFIRHMVTEKKQIAWAELYLVVVKCCEEDDLGSIMRLYNSSGTAVFSAYYDPWGVQKVTTNTIGFNRGRSVLCNAFVEKRRKNCGHEMLNDLQLINMRSATLGDAFVTEWRKNGRFYDPYVARFLSPDNYVQLPTSAQSFNRYSYCLNNPLKYVDQDGELFGIDDFVIAMALYNAANSMIHAAYFGKSVWKAGALSLLSSAATYGIGSTFGGVGGFGHEMLRAGAHGIATGGINVLNGGSFGSGFTSGTLSSGIGSFAQGIHMNTELMVASTTAMGALGAWATGGDVLEGAMQGLQIGVYNHALHGDGDIIYSKDPDGNIVGEIPTIIVYPNYSVANSFFIGTTATAFGFAAQKWRGMKTSTKSSLVYEGKKYIKNHTPWNVQTSNSKLYRKMIPEFMDTMGKRLTQASIGVCLAENVVDVTNNYRIGLGNIVDVAVGASSFTPIGPYLGVGYMVADYAIYKYTGLTIQQNMNAYYSISW